jgi:dihydrofolate synthase / folylpolyglutamate synthase
LPWRGGSVLLDGAHNLDGARALRQALQALGTPPLPVIFGAASDKDVRAMLAELAPLMSSLILTRSALSPRAASPEALAAQVQPGISVQLARAPEAALAMLPERGLSLVCGSLYLIGEIRPLLTGEQNEGRERWQ